MISRQAQSKYLKRRQDELATLEDLILQANFAEAALLFHKIKGSASTFGYDSLGNLAAALENECLSPKGQATLNASEVQHLFSAYRDTLLNCLAAVEN